MRTCKTPFYINEEDIYLPHTLWCWWMPFVDESKHYNYTLDKIKKTQFKQDSRQDIIKVLQVNSMTCICVPKSHYGINTHMKHLEEICWRFPYQQSNGFDEKHCRETLNSTSSCQVTI